jgi:hypothetical protein
MVIFGSGPAQLRGPLYTGLCCKTPKMPCGQFPANGPNEPQSLTDVASKPLPKSPASSSQDNVVPQMIIRSPRVRPGRFVFSDAKRLLQHNPPMSRHPQLDRLRSKTCQTRTWRSFIRSCPRHDGALGELCSLFYKRLNLHPKRRHRQRNWRVCRSNRALGGFGMCKAPYGNYRIHARKMSVRSRTFVSK